MAVFAALGIASYALAMVATLPASVFLTNKPWRSGVAGTLWNGEVGIAGGSKFEWHWAPLRSLTSLGFAADWTASGPETDLGGRLLASPGRVVLDSVSGSADAGLIAALQPDLPFSCALTMQVEMKRIAIGGGSQMAEGTVASDAGSCAASGGGTPTAVPALILTAEHIGTESRIRVAPMGQRRKTLVDATLSEAGTLDVRMTADGAQQLPFAGVPAGASIRSEL